MPSLLFSSQPNQQYYNAQLLYCLIVANWKVKIHQDCDTYDEFAWCTCTKLCRKLIQLCKCLFNTRTVQPASRCAQAHITNLTNEFICIQIFNSAIYLMYYTHCFIYATAHEHLKLDLVFACFLSNKSILKSLCNW